VTQYAGFTKNSIQGHNEATVFSSPIFKKRAILNSIMCILHQKFPTSDSKYGNYGQKVTEVIN